jgi:hypothetical protein
MTSQQDDRDAICVITYWKNGQSLGVDPNNVLVQEGKMKCHPINGWRAIRFEDHSDRARCKTSDIFKEEPRLAQS